MWKLKFISLCYISVIKKKDKKTSNF